MPHEIKETPTKKHSFGGIVPEHFSARIVAQADLILKRCQQIDSQMCNIGASLECVIADLSEALHRHQQHTEFVKGCKDAMELDDLGEMISARDRLLQKRRESSFNGELAKLPLNFIEGSTRKGFKATNDH